MSVNKALRFGGLPQRAGLLIGDYGEFLNRLLFVGVLLLPTTLHCGEVNSTKFSHLNVGGGGFTTGIQASPDGLTTVARVDVFGTYVFDIPSRKWQLLDTTARMPSGAIPGGGIEIVVAPSNSSVIYKWMNDGHLYRSVNRGDSFVQLKNFGTHDAGASNGQDSDGLISYAGRLDGYKMAVDPINPDVLYIGTNQGVVVSTNASQGEGSTPTFATVSGIEPAERGGSGYNFAFDYAGEATTGKTNVLFVSSEKRGIFKMSTPGGPFSLMLDSPTHVNNMACSPNHILWVADAKGQRALKYASDSWTVYNFSTIGIRPKALTMDIARSGPASKERVIFVDDGGALSITSNGGLSWTGRLPFTRLSKLIPWLQNTNESYMSSSLVSFDSKGDKIWLGEGIGVWTAPGKTNSKFTWTAATAGIESLEPQNVVASQRSSGKPALSAWDRALFGLSGIGIYPANHGASYATSIVGGWGLDWATSDGLTLVGLATWPNVATGSLGNKSFVTVGIDQTSVSSDEGQTWTPLPLSATSNSVILKASSDAVAGNNVISFNSAVPKWIGIGAALTDLSHPSAANAYVTEVMPNTIKIDRAISQPGVADGDAIKIGFQGSGQVQGYATTAKSGGGAILHFGSLPTDYVHAGMYVYDLSNTQSIASGTRVLTVSGGEVAVTTDLSSTVSSGDVIQFNDAASGGAIAVSSALNFCVTPSNNSPFPYCTENGGATWNPVNISGVPRAVSGSTEGAVAQVRVSDSSNFTVGPTSTVTDTSGCIQNGSIVQSIVDSNHIVVAPPPSCSAAADVIIPAPGWSSAYYLNIKNAAADRVIPNKFYLYNSQTGKVYVSVDSGSSWAPVNSRPSNLAKTYSLFGGQNLVLKSVPENASHLFLSGANTGFQDAPLIRSKDGGVTWLPVRNVTGVNAIGFGKASPSGGGYPSIYIFGKVRQTLSLWRSDDDCLSWINLGTANPNGSLDGIVDIDGDKNTYGQFYGAYSDSGWFFGAIK